MQTSVTVQLDERGQVTLPNTLRDAYALNPGDILTLTDLGGVFVLTPPPSQIDQIAAGIGQQLSERGETLESMLAALREVREEFGREA